MLAVDIETFDPNLHELGDGVYRHDGWIACIGMYNGKDYVCLKNLEPRVGKPAVWDKPEYVSWLESSEPKVFHNAMYDATWIVLNEGIAMQGVVHDTMTRAYLIDEYADLGLDDCCKRFHVTGKNFGDTVEKWFEANKKQLGIKGAFWPQIDKLWGIGECRKQVEAYNKQDCIATYNLFFAQEAQIAPHDEPYQRECELIPVLLLLKKNGARIDVKARDELTKTIRKKYAGTLNTLEYDYGITESIMRSPKKLADAMHALGVHSTVKTATGAESWSAGALELIDHPVVDVLQECKNYSSLLSKYLESSLVKTVCDDGKIHCTFISAKRDVGGAVTGRLSCRNPNLQNIPARGSKHGHDSYGNEMRELFIAEEGRVLAALDYKAIEYYLLAHFAVGNQAEWLREQARAGVDFHTVAMQVTGFPERDAMKTINYGIQYGMGLATMYANNRPIWRKLGEKNGMTGREYSDYAYRTYNAKFPVIKETMNWAQQVARAQGYVTTLGGRICHKPKPYYDTEKQRWNDGLYKMLNKLIQGTAADILKQAMVDMYRSGVLDVLTYHLTVHDENVLSVPYNKIGTEALLETKRIMEAPFRSMLKVPIIVNCGVGPNWGYKHAEGIWENMQKGVFTDLQLA